jgi:hypothetical protein
MRPDWITFVAISLGALFAGAVAAFLLYVPVLSVATVSTVVLALIVMFGLGAHAGGRRIRIARHLPPSSKEVA